MVFTVKLPPAEVARAALVLIGIGLAAYLVWRVQEVLFLLMLAILLATAIEPIVNRLRRGPFSRGSGIVVVYTAIMLVIGTAGYLVVPNVLGQAGTFAQSLPERLQALGTQVAGLGQPSVRGVLLGLLDQASRAVQSPAQPGQEELVAVGTAAAQTIISLVTVFVLAF